MNIITGPKQRRAALACASIFCFRMLGLFMILPIFSLQARHLLHATPTLIGFALGIYGLSQALLQIPFGLLSDRLGRKRVITAGLIIFAFGSLVAAMSQSIYGVIIGRALQGAGAVGSSLIALVADLTDEHHRTQAMAIVGMCIGLSFSVAMVAGPFLAAHLGLSGIFYLTAILAGLGIIILYTVVPSVQAHFHYDSETKLGQLTHVLKNTELLRFDFGIAASHAILTASFIAIPLALHEYTQIHETQQWMFYLPVLVLSFFAMVPFIIIAEKKQRMKGVFLGAIVCVALSQILLLFTYHHIWPMALSLFLFMAAFNLLEASLPSLVSKAAPAASKGTAMGIYSSSQFFGIFIGGSLGGVLLSHHHLNAIFIACSFLALIWLGLAWQMPQPKYLTTRFMQIDLKGLDAGTVQNELLKINGIADAVVIAEQNIAHIKVDKKILDESALAAWTQ